MIVLNPLGLIPWWGRKKGVMNHASGTCLLASHDRTVRVSVTLMTIILCEGPLSAGIGCLCGSPGHLRHNGEGTFSVIVVH